MKITKKKLLLPISIVTAFLLGSSIVFAAQVFIQPTLSGKAVVDVDFFNKSTTQGYSQVFNSGAYTHVIFSVQCFDFPGMSTILAQSRLNLMTYPSPSSGAGGEGRHIIIQYSDDQITWYSGDYDAIELITCGSMIGTDSPNSVNGSLSSQVSNLTQGIYYRIYNPAPFYTDFRTALPTPYPNDIWPVSVMAHFTKN